MSLNVSAHTAPSVPLRLTSTDWVTSFKQDAEKGDVFERVTFAICFFGLASVCLFVVLLSVVQDKRRSKR